MNDKLIIERYKTAKREAKLSEPAHLFTTVEIADLKAMAMAVLAVAVENKVPRSIRPVIAKPKSQTRIEFEAMIGRIADRWEGVTLPSPTLHTAYPGKPCRIANTNHVEDSDVPLHELLKQAKRLIWKASRK